MVVSTTSPRTWHANPYADIEREARALRTWQLLAVATGVASLGFGLTLLCWPDPTLLVVGGVLGGWLLVVGALRLVEAVAPGELGGASRALSAMAGLLYLIAGIVCVRGLLHSLELLAIVVGIAWLAGGLCEVISAVIGGRGGWARLGAVASGAIGVLGGLVLAFWPAIPLTALAVTGGGWLLGIGVVQLTLAVRASRPPAEP